MAFQTPDWVKHAVFYQNLSPRRFAFTLRVDSPCKKEDAKGGRHTPVSYTHLTLPTILRV